MTTTPAPTITPPRTATTDITILGIILTGTSTAPGCAGGHDRELQKGFGGVETGSWFRGGNDEGSEEDLIIAPDKPLSYVFIGLGFKHA